MTYEKQVLVILGDLAKSSAQLGDPGHPSALEVAKCVTWQRCDHAYPVDTQGALVRIAYLIETKKAGRAVWYSSAASAEAGRDRVCDAVLASQFDNHDEGRLQRLDPVFWGDAAVTEHGFGL